VRDPQAPRRGRSLPTRAGGHCPSARPRRRRRSVPAARSHLRRVSWASGR
jgi:hypothetical protein